MRTIQGHKDKINWHDLPATFQDAVTVCRSMDVKYLWIDSLCILQRFADITSDELEATGQDFAQENSTMARTYQNSHFTISADVSTHMNSGIFSKLPIDDHGIEITTDDGNRAFFDKLPALSGLAQQRKQVRGGVYLAGLWQDSLLHDLCWYHVRNYNDPTSGGVGRRSALYRAPSWSWASVDIDSGCSWWWTGAVGLHPIFPRGEPRQACVILESACEPETADTTGEVRSGFLDIKVTLIAAEICRDPKQRVVWTINKVETSLTLKFFKPDWKLSPAMNSRLLPWHEALAPKTVVCVLPIALMAEAVIKRSIASNLIKHEGAVEIEDEVVSLEDAFEMKPAKQKGLLTQQLFRRH
ncbi:hypothetical protein ACJA88_013996 [Fusarium oxysporum]